MSFLKLGHNENGEIIHIKELRKEHARILKKADYFKKSLSRKGLVSEKSINMFERGICDIIKWEEDFLFPQLKDYMPEDGHIFVMTYTHDKIKTELINLRNALFNQESFEIRKAAEKLVKALRYHIEKEDEVVLSEAEKNIKQSQIGYLSSMFAKMTRD